jgi:hypothetical protein
MAINGSNPKKPAKTAVFPTFHDTFVMSMSPVQIWPAALFSRVFLGFSLRCGGFGLR